MAGSATPTASPRQRLSALLVIAALWAGAAPGSGIAAEPAPARGMLLVAGRDLTDANFASTVVLLTSYGAEGAMGLIVNRPIGVGPEELLPDVEGIDGYDGELHGGGPVSIHRVFMLIRSDAAPGSAQHVFADVYASHSRDLLDDMDRKLFSAGSLRFYAGYAGWGAGQLDAEIARGDWHVATATVEAVFGNDPERVWRQLLPPPPAIIASHSLPVVVTRR